ncbi:MAG: hypothetical protein KJO00_04790, partial [Bacteroidia bacterium]|nr:hypothetical protein [Bacteroidia bacterium]
MENSLLEESSATQKWQNRAFPFMVWTICFFSVFFIVATAFQLYSIRSKIEYQEKNEIVFTDKFENIDSQIKLDQLTLRTQAQLEVYALQRRYHQSNMLLISRIWIQYLGFLIGTILA